MQKKKIIKTNTKRLRSCSDINNKASQYKKSHKKSDLFSIAPWAPDYIEYDD